MILYLSSSFFNVAEERDDFVPKGENGFEQGEMTVGNTRFGAKRRYPYPEAPCQLVPVESTCPMTPE